MDRNVSFGTREDTKFVFCFPLNNLCAKTLFDMYRIDRYDMYKINSRRKLIKARRKRTRKEKERGGDYIHLAEVGVVGVIATSSPAMEGGCGGVVGEEFVWAGPRQEGGLRYNEGEAGVVHVG